MKIYAAVGKINYEDTSVLGVFTTRDLAFKCCEKNNAEGILFDSYQILTFTLDKINESDFPDNKEAVEFNELKGETK